MNEMQDYMKSYFMQHKSKAHETLKKILKNPIEEFTFIDEFLIPFYDSTRKTAIILLAEDHDHADGYYIESLIQRRLTEKKITCIFITERDIESNLEFVKKKLEQMI